MKGFLPSKFFSVFWMIVRSFERRLTCVGQPATQTTLKLLIELNLFSFIATWVACPIESCSVVMSLDIWGVGSQLCFAFFWFLVDFLETRFGLFALWKLGWTDFFLSCVGFPNKMFYSLLGFHWPLKKKTGVTKSQPKQTTRANWNKRTQIWFIQKKNNYVIFCNLINCLVLREHFGSWGNLLCCIISR